MNERTRKPEKKWNRISKGPNFNLYQNVEDHQLFEIRWRKSGRSYGKRQFRAESIELASRTAFEKTGLVPANEKTGEGISINDAFSQALAATRRGTGSKRDWLSEQVRFMEWLDKSYPLCSEWHLLTRKVIREYIAEIFSGRSPNRVRLALQPVTQTAGFMERELGLTNVAKGLGIGAKLAKEPAFVYLVDVVRFVDWLSERDPILEAAACLQGLAGLQMQEALRLTWDKVDVDRGLIEISGVVKNRYRNRVIPICSRTMEALARIQFLEEDEQVISIKIPVIRTPRGGSYCDTEDGWRRYSRSLSKKFREWNSSISWAPKDLRNCLPTFAVEQGIHRRSLGAVLGSRTKKCDRSALHSEVNFG